MQAIIIETVISLYLYYLYTTFIFLVKNGSGNSHLWKEVLRVFNLC